MRRVVEGQVTQAGVFGGADTVFDTGVAAAAPEADAVGWEAQPLLPRWASRGAEHLLRGAVLAAHPTALADHGTHAALVRIRSTAYRAALYRDALAGRSVPAEFPFFDRAVLEAALAPRPWERTDPWQPKPLLRAALANTVPVRDPSRRFSP